jgi:hypothetical protein
MDILSAARKLEATLTEQMDRVAARVQSTAPREPLQTVHAIVDAVARHIEPAGRGRYVFPFNVVKVAVSASSRETRARLAAVIESSPSLVDRIRDRIAAAGCDANAVDVRTSYVPAPGEDWETRDFHLDLQRLGSGHEKRSRDLQRAGSSQETPGPRGVHDPIEPAAGAEFGFRDLTPPALQLTVELGEADQPSYKLSLPRVNLGRCADLRDSRHRLVRTNHVVFADGDSGVNATVSRQHAHIVYDAGSGHHRVCDDGSAQGTSLLREGRIIGVPRGTRGIRIVSGDVIVLGEARVRVTLG